MADRIKRRREKLDLSVKEVAAACGVKPSAVYQWESNATEPTGVNLVPLATILNTYETWITTGKGPEVREIPTDALSADESELIEAYRTLSPDAAISMKTTIINLAAQRRKRGRGGL